MCFGVKFTKGEKLLNQIEKQFETFMQAMYGTKTTSEAQEKDIEKSFYAGMFVCMSMFQGLDDNEDIAVKQLDILAGQITKKMEELTMRGAREL